MQVASSLGVDYIVRVRTHTRMCAMVAEVGRTILFLQPRVPWPLPPGVDLSLRLQQKR